MTEGRKTYIEMLRDPRWQKRRLEIMSLSKFSCEECGDATTTLNVHHKLYRKGAMPWEYSDGELACLCETCHHAETMIRQAIAESMARLRPFWLERILGFAEGIEALIAHCENRPEESDRIFEMRSEFHAMGFLEALRGDVGHDLARYAASEMSPLNLSDIEYFLKKTRENH